MWLILNSIQWLLILIATTICGSIAMLLALISPIWSFYFSKHVWARCFCIIAGARVEVKNLDRIKNLEEHVIFCANHQSNYDIIAMYRAAIKPIYFIAKKELKNLPFIGWYVSAIGMIFIDRSDREKAMKSMKEAGQLIKSGKDVITFPEGTRSRTGELKMFKRGSFIIAKNSNIKIVPVGISGSYDVNPPKSIKLRPKKITVNFGEPINPNENQNLSPEKLADLTKEKVAHLIDEI